MGESEEAIYEDLLCDYCGVAVQLGTLDVTIQRAEDRNGFLAWDTLDLYFCTEAHAASYLGQHRLPAPNYESPEVQRRRWSDRLFDAGAILVVLLLVGTILTGAWTLLRWLAP